MDTTESINDYQAQDDSRVLAKGEEIKMDKKRHAKAKKISMTQAKAHAKVAGANVSVDDTSSLEKGFQ